MLGGPYHLSMPQPDSLPPCLLCSPTSLTAIRENRSSTPSLPSNSTNAVTVSAQVCAAAPSQARLLEPSATDQAASTAILAEVAAGTAVVNRITQSAFHSVVTAALVEEELECLTASQRVASTAVCNVVAAALAAEDSECRNAAIDLIKHVFTNVLDEAYRVEAEEAVQLQYEHDAVEHAHDQAEAFVTWLVQQRVKGTCRITQEEGDALLARIDLCAVRVIQQLGQGTFGGVFSCVAACVPGGQGAVKLMPLLDDASTVGCVDEACLLIELKRTRSLGTLAVHGLEFAFDVDGNFRAWLFMELANGSLADRMSSVFDWVSQRVLAMVVGV